MALKTDVVLLADAGDVTVARRTAFYTYGKFEVILPEGREQQETDNRIEDGYIARAHDGNVGRFDFGFIRADATVNIDAGTSDLETQIDSAELRAEGDIFFESDITPAGFNGFVPGVDYDTGDIVTVRRWGTSLALPVTSIEMEVSESGGTRASRVHVSGQLIHDAASRRRSNDDLRQQIAAEKRERLRQVGAVDQKATQAKDAADAAVEAVNDADGVIQGHVKSAREYSEESHEHSEASQRHSADAKVYSDLSHVYSQQSQQLSAQSVAHSAVSIEYSEESQKHSQKSQEHSEASFAHSDAARIYSEESHEHSQKSQEYSEASFGYSDAARIYSDAANTASQQAQQYSQQVQDLQPEIEQAASDAQTASEQSSQYSAESKTASEQSSVHSQAATDAAELSQESLRQAELARDAAETSRRDAETKRDEAEAARRAGFAAMTAASAAMAQAEQSRAEAEEQRRLAENERAAAEDQRRQAETARSGAESARDNAEQKRAAAEGERKLAETARSGAETARSTAERHRAWAETARSEAETARSGAEAARDTAEQKRAAAETERALAEAARDNAEQKRAAAETEREKAETARQETVAAFTATQNEIDDMQNDAITALESQAAEIVELQNRSINMAMVDNVGSTHPDVTVSQDYGATSYLATVNNLTPGTKIHADFYTKATNGDLTHVISQQYTSTGTSRGVSVANGNRVVNIMWARPNAQQIPISLSSNGLTPSRVTWTDVPGLSRKANGRVTSGQLTIRGTWSAANRGSTYGIRVLIGTSVFKSYTTTTLGPLSFFGDGESRYTVSVSNLKLNANQTLKVQVYSSASGTAARALNHVSAVGSWIEHAS